MQLPVQFAPGTTKEPQVTDFDSIAMVDTYHVHCPDGIWRTVPEWVEVNYTGDTNFMGGARTIWAGIRNNASNGGYFYFIATNTRLQVVKNNVLYNITPLVSTATASLGTDPLAVVSGDQTMTVTYTGHGLAVGDRIKLSGATDFGGVTANTYINIEHIVATVPGANTFTVELGIAASSTASGGGGSVEIFKQIASGNLDQSTGRGYGGGKYGVGLYGVSKRFTNVLSYPRIWSVAMIGDIFYFCPGDYTTGDGQKIYEWDGNIEVAPVVRAGAPTDCSWIYSRNNALHAICDGNRLDKSEIGDATSWTPGAGSTAYSDDVERVSRFVSEAQVRGTSVLFTENMAFQEQYVAAPDYYEIIELMLSDGIIAPRAFAILEDVVFWMGNRGFYLYDGSGVRRIQNNQNEDWIFENINYSQVWKCFAWADVQNGEIIFQFPTGNNDEPTDCVRFNVAGGHWTLDKRTLTAAQQRPLGGKFFSAYSDDPSSEGVIYNEFVENDNLDLGAYAISNWGAYDKAENNMRMNRMTYDIDQDGTVLHTIEAKRYARTTVPVQSKQTTVTANTEYASPRISGRLRRHKFATSGAGSRFTLGRIYEDVILQGRR